MFWTFYVVQSLLIKPDLKDFAHTKAGKHTRQ